MDFVKSRRGAAVFAAAAIVVVLAGCGGAKNKFQKEVDNEALAVKLARETVAGEYELITTDELKALMDKDADLLIVDTMPLEASYQKAHVLGARQFLFPKELMEEWDTGQTAGKSQDDYRQLLGEDTDKLIVIYCGYVKCARSHNGTKWARHLGYTNVKRYPGGIYAWKGAGNPTESGQ
jgi:thiosulfate/3-mercaptopyruvate sulfurtransferase